MGGENIDRMTWQKMHAILGPTTHIVPVYYPRYLRDSGFDYSDLLQAPVKSPD